MVASTARKETAAKEEAARKPGKSRKTTKGGKSGKKGGKAPPQPKTVGSTLRRVIDGNAKRVGGKVKGGNVVRDKPTTPPTRGRHAKASSGFDLGRLVDRLKADRPVLSVIE